MDRMEEYNALRRELEREPEALAFSVPRARARAGERRRRRLIAAPLTALAAAFACFVLLVNVSVTVAQACEGLPFLRELAEAVTFSPSLRRAVENDYVQTVGLTDTQNGVTMTIEYLIVDQKQVNVFYRLEAKTEAQLEVHPTLEHDGEELHYSVVSSFFTGQENGDLLHFTADFTDSDVPERMTAVCEVTAWDGPHGSKGTSLATFRFPLAFDPSFTAQGKTVAVNQPFTIDGQHFTVTTVELYPTNMRINLSEDAGNTAWLESLTFTVYAGGAALEATGGIAATGNPETPSFLSYRAGSVWFSGCETLTISITGAVWRDKDWPDVVVDLPSGAASNLPAGVTLAAVDGNTLEFHIPRPSEGSPLRLLFGHEYFDPDGNAYSWAGQSAGGRGGEGICYNRLTLAGDYAYDTVILHCEETGRTLLETPVEITVETR